MTKPDADLIIADARKLQSERFLKRDADLEERAMERFNETKVEVPLAYQKTTDQQPKLSIIEDEGQQIATLVHNMPVPHIPPPAPEDQPKTTVEEKFLMAWEMESQMVFGPLQWQGTLAQIHDKIAWEYTGWRKVPYKGQPKAPDESANADEIAAYGMKNDRYKRDAGITAYCERRYVPTNTAYPVGKNIYDVDRFYEIKEVPERDLRETYGVTRNQDGSFSRPSETPNTTPSGYPQNQSGTEAMVKIVEYWDRDWCMIVAESKVKYVNGGQVDGGFMLDEWEHGWGRTPYFPRPARITDQQAEERRFASPIDPLYVEMPGFKRSGSMVNSVSYQTAFSPLQIVTRETGDVILDDSGKAQTFLDLEPGKARQLAPGQEIRVIPQSPEVANLFREHAERLARVEHYSLSPVAKGVSPGADTANSSLTNLHRYQLSTLDPLAEQASLQANLRQRFVLERIEEMNERVYVFDRDTDTYLSLAAEDIVSVNVQGKVTPDQGQFQLLIEKHAAELKQLGLITLQDMYSMWGKENPEEYVLELKAEKLAESLEPVINNQIINDLGMMDAVNAMIQANQQQGSARQAVPGLMNQMQQMNQTGTGQGAAGQPRTEGVRSPAVQETTQPQLTAGAA